MEFIIKGNCLVDIKNPELDIHIPEGITSLGPDVFNEGKNMKNIYFPSTLVECKGERVLLFRYAENLIVSAGNPKFKSDGGVLFSKDGKVLVNCPMGKKGKYIIPKGAKIIAQRAFSCSSLNEVILPNSLENIESEAFSDSMIEWIKIPSNVKHIGKDAFIGEYSSNSIIVTPYSYAYRYAKDNDLIYNCESVNNEIVWSDYSWVKQFENAGNRLDRGTCRDLRKNVFENTVEIVKTGSYMTTHGRIVQLNLNRHLTKQTELYDKEIHPVHKGSLYKTEIAAINSDCLEFARRVVAVDDNVSVLNMASRQNPGGGVFSGAGAQEEYLFRCTDYYRSLFQYGSFSLSYGISSSLKQYPLDRNFGGCFSPDVTVFRSSEENGYRLLRHPWKVNIIAVPGMNRPKLIYQNGEWRIDDHLVECVKNKIRTIFRIAVLHGQQTLILGALGCGAFANPPKHIAELFKEVLNEYEFNHVFRRIFFVIKEDYNSHGRNFKPFKDIFGEFSPLQPLTSELLLSFNCSNDVDRTKISKILHRERCGNNLYWTLYSDGLLSISGTGKMPDYINHLDCYFGEGQAPWIGCERYGVIPHILRIEEGITHVGANAFESFSCLRMVYLPQTLESIGDLAFYACFNIEQINKPVKLFYIAPDAFREAGKQI